MNRKEMEILGSYAVWRLALGKERGIEGETYIDRCEGCDCTVCTACESGCSGCCGCGCSSCSLNRGL